MPSAPPAPVAPYESSIEPALQDADAGASWLLARIGGERFALPLPSVGELLEEPDVSAVPGSPAELLGLVVTRWGRLPVWNPSRVLGQAASLPPAAVLVIESSGKRAAIAVDEAADVLEIATDAVMPIAALDDPFRVVMGVARDDSGLVTVLDVARVIRSVGSTEEQTS